MRIENSRHEHAGAPPRDPVVPFPSPPADDRDWDRDRDMPGAEPEDAPERLTNAKAAFALVMSLLWLVGVGAFLGVVFGIVAARECRRTGEPGRGVALAAVLLGVLGLVFSPPFL